MSVESLPADLLIEENILDPAIMPLMMNTATNQPIEWCFIFELNMLSSA